MLANLLSSSPSTTQILQLILAIPCIMIALSFHEAAHGYAAYKMGDPTARNLGRLTVNPIKHLDLFGTLMMLFVGYGWAKPVPINTRYFRDQKKGMAISALAGPLTNFALGIIGLLLSRIFLVVCYTDGIYEAIVQNNTALSFVTAVLLLLETFAIYNFSFAVFNMIPIPPFDGSRVLFAFLPDKYYFGIMQYERYIMIAVLLFFTVGPGFSISNIVGYITTFFERSFDLIPFLKIT